MRNVQILTGDPKKALMRLSVPIMISNLVFTLYNLADGIWVAGLGTDALSAVGIFFPLFIILSALSMGIGIGATSAISRKIGAGDKAGAENTAMHAILFGFVISLATMSTFPFLEVLLKTVGAKGEVLKLSLDYSRVILLFSPFLVFNNAFVGILNGEGNTKRTMYANVTGALLNMMLDPLFIYVLGFGIAGAAYATSLSLIVSFIIMLYYFIGKRTFLRLGGFKADRKITANILRVGLPSSVSMLSMSVAIIFLNLIIIETGSSDGIAVFTSAWRIIHFGLIPLFGIAGAVTPIIGASYGAKNAENLKTAYLHAVITSIKIELLIALTIAIFAPQFARLFTYTEASSNIYSDLILTLRFLSVFLPFAPLSFMTIATFQGLGKGERSLAITLMRTIIFQLSFAYLFAVNLRMRFLGVLLGVVLGNVAASLIAFIWGLATIRGVLKLRYSDTAEIHRI